MLENDLDDVPPAGVAMARPEGDHAAILKSGRWKEAVQAYLATITFSDAMVGRLIDGFDKSPYKDNTIIVLWSDHGWHLGEKQHWRKFALWEEATRSPLIWVVPGVTQPGTVCRRSVDFMHIYPTLCDLCGLPVPKHVQGESIRAALGEPCGAWNKPALMTYKYRTTRCAARRGGTSAMRTATRELYHDADGPLRMDQPRHGSRNSMPCKAELAKWLPKSDAPVAEGRTAPKSGEEGEETREAGVIDEIA